jgi:signal transduction histidine kinase
LVELSEDEARLVVTDNGRGFTPAAVLPAGAGAFRDPDGGVGLLGIRERAALAGGHAEVDSSPGAGTTVTVRIPRSDARPATGAVHQTTAGRAP